MFWNELILQMESPSQIEFLKVAGTLIVVIMFFINRGGTSQIGFLKIAGTRLWVVRFFEGRAPLALRLTICGAVRMFADRATPTFAFPNMFFIYRGGTS